MGQNSTMQSGSFRYVEYVEDAVELRDLTAKASAIAAARKAAAAPLPTIEGSQLREFTILLRDGNVVVVQGHSAKVIASDESGETASYAVVLQEPQGDVLVAVFPISNVRGVFSAVPKHT